MLKNSLTIYFKIFKKKDTECHCKQILNENKINTKTFNIYIGNMHDI